MLPENRENGLGDQKIEFSEEALREIIHSYTREAGLRNLEREIARVCRKIARSITEGETAPEVVTGADVQRYLGAPRFFSEVWRDKPSSSPETSSMRSLGRALPIE